MKGFKSHHGIRDFLDKTVILFNQVILFNLEYFNKTDQTSKHQQDVNILQTSIVDARKLSMWFASTVKYHSGLCS